MRTRNIGIMLTALVLLVVSVIAYQRLATAASKKAFPAPTFLSQEYLRGSMQGKSGIALDISGDGNEDLIIGAPYAQHKDDSGALLIYLATPGGFPAKPVSILEGEGNLGGSLVALGKVSDDDKGSFAAGAVNGSGPNASLAGTVIVYKGDAIPRKVAVLEGERAMDRFGFTLASGDLNGDGKPDLVVGAPMHSPSPALYQQGAVYVYYGPIYSPASAVKIPATLTNGGIGFSLAAGDINGDGIDDLLLGASGRVIGYYGGMSFPSSSPDVVFASTEAGFGRSIEVIWDLNSDGFKEIAIGAYQAVVSNVSETGSLFILKGGSGNRTVSVTANPAPSDVLARINGEPNSGQFASTIRALRNSTGERILAVSAQHADGNPWPMTGKIFLFGGGDLIPGTSVASVRSVPGEARDMHLGSFLDLVEGKWGMWLVAGAPTENSNTGRVRLFDLGSVAR